MGAGREGPRHAGACQFIAALVSATSLFSVAAESLPALHGSSNVVTVPRSELVNKCLELMSLLQLEFGMVLPCSDARTVVMNTLDLFIQGSVLTESGRGVPTGYPNLHVDLGNLDWEDVHGSGDARVPDETYKVSVEEEDYDFLEFLRSLLASYVESYWVVACSLLNLVGVSMEERVFFRMIQKVAQDKLQEGALHFEESFAADTFRNAVQLYEQWGILQHYTKDSLRIFYLSEQWNADEVVVAVINFVQSFRQ